jgi:hypothetical protein
VLDIGDWGLFTGPAFGNNPRFTVPAVGAWPLISSEAVVNSPNFCGNAYYDAVAPWRYLSAGPATGLGMGVFGNNGHFTFQSAVAGAAGAPISWGQSMILLSPFSTTDLSTDGMTAMLLTIRKGTTVYTVQQVYVGAAGSATGGANPANPTGRVLYVPN